MQIPMKTRQDEKKDTHLLSHTPAFSCTAPPNRFPMSGLLRLGFLVFSHFDVLSKNFKNAALFLICISSLLAIPLAALPPLQLQTNKFLQSNRLEINLSS